MFTDEHRTTVWNEIRQHDLRAFARFLPPEVLQEAAQRTGKPLGRGPLHLGNMVWLAVASALNMAKCFADILGLTLKLLSDAEGFASTPLAAEQRKGKRRKRSHKRSKHDPRRDDPTEVSEEAFRQGEKAGALGILAEPAGAARRTFSSPACTIGLLERFPAVGDGWYHDSFGRLAAAAQTLWHIQQRQRKTTHDASPHGDAAASLGADSLQLCAVSVQDVGKDCGDRASFPLAGTGFGVCWTAVSGAMACFGRFNDRMHFSGFGCSKPQDSNTCVSWGRKIGWWSMLPPIASGGSKHCLDRSPCVSSTTKCAVFVPLPW